MSSYAVWQMQSLENSLKTANARISSLEAAIRAIQELDKCPLCDDNQDHHPECLIALAKVKP
jgi:hypothetical protein